jgi:hypothetical protein
MVVLLYGFKTPYGLRQRQAAAEKAKGLTPWIPSD